MATNLCTGLVVPHTTSARLYQEKRNPLLIVCSSSESSSKRVDKLSESVEPKNKSLSEQLKPLANVTLPTERDRQSQLLSNSKSIWVNPTKPKRSVLSLQRQKRSTSSYNSKLNKLGLYSKALNACSPEKTAILSVLEQIPYTLSRDDALWILTGLKGWEKSYYFFCWIKNLKFFPMETILYNVTMKSLKFGEQFGLIEVLANDMITNNVDLDNITYSTIITCAKRCEYFDKAMEWFERMYKTGLVPDEVTYSAVLDVYAKLGKVEEAMSLYERGVASGWKPDPVAFSMMVRMFGNARDYDGIKFVLKEMETLEVQRNCSFYYTIIEAMGKVRKPDAAKNHFEEMIETGLTPDVKTLTAMLKTYGKFSLEKDAMELWERVKLNNWKVDLFVYNTMISLCADFGNVPKAEELFSELKKISSFKPDSWTYSAILNVYSSAGNSDKAMELFEEMSELGVILNVMGCTCLIQCLGRAGRIDELVSVYEISIERWIKPDDKLCCCLLSVLSLCSNDEDDQKILTCLQKANPKLAKFIKLLEDGSTGFEDLKQEFRIIVSKAGTEARRPLCNCLIDSCRAKNLNRRAHELLYIGTMYGLYPDLHKKSTDAWCLDVRTLSVGAAETAIEEWMKTVEKFVHRNEELPSVFYAVTGAGTHKFSHGLANSVAAHLEKLGAPFQESDQRAGCLWVTKQKLVSWIQSKNL